MHQEVAAFGGTNETGDSGLPFLKALRSPWQPHDVVGGVLEGDELVTARQWDQIIENQPLTCSDVTWDHGRISVPRDLGRAQ